MDHPPTRAFVRMLLERAAAYPWVLQDIGLLGLRLDERRIYRLHVWDPTGAVGEPPIHDHPFHFTSSVVAGAITNTRYVEDPSGNEFRRVRYRPVRQEDRRADSGASPPTPRGCRGGPGRPTPTRSG